MASNTNIQLVRRDDDAGLAAVDELELPLRRARRPRPRVEVAALPELHGLQLLEGALRSDAAVEHDRPAVVRIANAAPELDRRTTRAPHEDRQLVLLVDAWLRLAVVEAQPRLEAARRPVVGQRVLRIREDPRVAPCEPLGHAEVGRHAL